jgi:GGDEF domain-containing protein
MGPNRESQKSRDQILLKITGEEFILVSRECDVSNQVDVAFRDGD